MGKASLSTRTVRYSKAHLNRIKESLEDIHSLMGHTSKELSGITCLMATVSSIGQTESSTQGSGKTDFKRELELRLYQTVNNWKEFGKMATG